MKTKYVCHGLISSHANFRKFWHVGRKEKEPPNKFAYRGS